MNSLADALAAVEDALGSTTAPAFRSGELRRLDDDAVLSLMTTVAGIVRQAEAVLLAVVGEVEQREDAGAQPLRPTTRYGCRSIKELVQRATLLSGRRVGEVMRAARAIQRPASLTSGEQLSARYPALREAAADGVVGVDAVAAVAGGLDAADCSDDARRAADGEIAASARGEGGDGGPVPSADDLRLQAQVWAMYLDQDGAELREARALRKRGLTLGVCHDGLVPVRGHLLPEVAGQVQQLFDSILNPKGDGPDAPAGPRFVDSGLLSPVEGAADPRTRVQRQHDAFATVVTVAARSGALPTIGGAAPTLVVSVASDDLEAGRGHAHIDGCDEPVTLAVARQIACAGVVQRVTSDGNGRIRAIEILDRVFAAHQRKAIALRDGGCIIPGCHVAASWCEIHHVTEHAVGAPTHTDNGVLLCWYHHRTLDSSGWKVRMRDGVPEVRGPHWWDATVRWRQATTSPVRLSRQLRARNPGVRHHPPSTGGGMREAPVR